MNIYEISNNSRKTIDFGDFVNAVVIAKSKGKALLKLKEEADSIVRENFCLVQLIGHTSSDKKAEVVCININGRY